MPVYQYRCPECGVVERFHAIGTAPPAETCPGCGNPARRVFSPPSLRRTPAPLASAFEHAERSRHDPAVVRREPGRARAEANGTGDPAVRKNPALQKLVGKKAASDLRVARHPADPA